MLYRYCDTAIPRHVVVYNPSDDLHDVTGHIPQATSKLLEWFALNARDDEAAHLRYVDLPEYYVSDSNSSIHMYSSS